MTDKPKYAFIRHGNALVPEMEIDRAALDGVAQGQRVRVEILQWRNPDRLRAWWAYLSDCIKSCGLTEWSLQSMADYVKIECGHFEAIKLPNGDYFRRARSIANASDMTEDEMVALFRNTEFLLANVFGFSPEEGIKDAAGSLPGNKKGSAYIHQG